MTDINSNLEQLTAIIKKGDEPACTNALKSVWDLVPIDSPNLRTVYQFPGLIDAIIKVLDKDEQGEARVKALGAI